MKQVELKSKLEALLEANQVTSSQWQEGYTSDDVERILPLFQKGMEDCSIQGDLYMIWDSYIEEFDMVTGSSYLWLCNQEGLGIEISVPLLGEDSLDAFVEDVLSFHEGKTTLQHLDFELVDNFNAA